jgi:hypothetical protein
MKTNIARRYGSLISELKLWHKSCQSADCDVGEENIPANDVAINFIRSSGK